MPEFTVSPALEYESLRDLQLILAQAKLHHPKLALIGGYAVRAYTSPNHYRGTKDLDFITPKTDLNKLKGLLKHLDYDLKDTRHGIKAIKKTLHGDIKLDVAVETVVDDSTSLRYPIPESAFTNARELNLDAFSEENAGLHITATIAPFSDVMIMKLLTDITQRPRDKFDAVAMLLNSHYELDQDEFKRNVQRAQLADTISGRLTDLLVMIKQNKLRKLWKEYSRFELLPAQEKTIKQRLTSMLSLF